MFTKLVHDRCFSFVHPFDLTDSQRSQVITICWLCTWIVSKSPCFTLSLHICCGVYHRKISIDIPVVLLINALYISMILDEKPLCYESMKFNFEVYNINLDWCKLTNQYISHINNVVRSVTRDTILHAVR